MPAIRYFLLLNVVSIKQHSKYCRTRSRSLRCIKSMPSRTNMEIPPPLSLKLKVWSHGLSRWIGEKPLMLQLSFLAEVSQVSVKIRIPKGLLMHLKNASYSFILPLLIKLLALWCIIFNDLGSKFELFINVSVEWDVKLTTLLLKWLKSGSKGSSSSSSSRNRKAL